MKYKCTQCGQSCELRTSTDFLPRKCVLCRNVIVNWIPSVEIECKKCFKKRPRSKKEK